MVRRVNWVAVVLVILACAALYLVGNGRVALWDRDEPRYAMASRWMARTGDWVVPRFGWGADPEMARTAKPAGIYWAQAVSMKALGETEFAARLPSVVATTLLLAGLGVVIGRRLGAARAFWTVFVLGTSAMLVVASKMCVTDAVLLLWVTAGQVCLLAMYRGSRSIWLSVAFWVAAGVGGLVKGPVVLGVYGMTLLVLGALDWRRRGPGEVGGRTGRVTEAIRWWKTIRPIMGLVILAAVVGPWLVMVERRHPGFLSTAVSHDVIQRMKTGLEEHKGPPGYYLATIFGTFFPWSLLLPLTFVIAWGRWKRRKDVRFALAAVIGPWILMEAVQTKLVHYVLPIFPPLAYLVGDAILRCLRRRHDGLVNRVSAWGVGAWSVIVAAAAAAPWLAAAYYRPLPVAAMAAMTAVGVACAVLVFVAFFAKRPAAGLLGMGIGFAAFCAVGFGWFLPEAGFMRLPVQIAAKLVNEGATGDGDVLMTGYKERSLAWYQGGTIDEVWANYFTTHEVAEWPSWFVVTPTVINGQPEKDIPPLPEEKRRWLDRVATFKGLNYAGGRWVEVWILRKKNPDPGTPAARGG
jgi:4-amino-4-deoxy-L-arabinose transferase-like glycosyltransferase